MIYCITFAAKTNITALTMEGLTEKIKIVAKKHGKTISMLADELGVAQPQLSRTINNPRITIEDLEKLANAIGCNISDFVVEKQDTIFCPYCGKPIRFQI